MSRSEIIPVLKDIREQVDRVEAAMGQLDAACSTVGTAEGEDLAAAHSASLEIAAKLTKAASVILLFCRDIENAQK
jgi:hypothetical protein